MITLNEAAYEFLTQKYTEDGRYYHGLEHIETLLNIAPEFRRAFDLTERQYDALLISIWFHDCEYDVNATDNEERSAFQAARFYANHPSIRDIFQAITDTRHHVPTSGNILSLALCDIDLIPLASSIEKYSLYTSQIRKEYGYLSTEKYIKGRIEFLSDMLGYDRIFHSDYAHGKYENKARQNMSSELSLLGSLIN